MDLLYAKTVGMNSRAAVSIIVTDQTTYIQLQANLHLFLIGIMLRPDLCLPTELRAFIQKECELMNDQKC